MVRVGKSDAGQLENIKNLVDEISQAISQEQGKLIKKAAELQQAATMLSAGRAESLLGQKIMDVTGKELDNYLKGNEENKKRLKSNIVKELNEIKEDVKEIEQQSNIRPKGRQ